ncbi:MAG: CopG family transcriptional regulator [Gemmatimonadetes bacterium]|nr:MAG: CopG family transcriptional regulator [Gemmatimonadota bacterium]
MSRSKIAVTLDRDTLARIDRMVRDGVFPNRSRAIQHALDDHLERVGRTRLARECAKLDRASERAIAEQGMKSEFNRWPAY